MLPRNFEIYKCFVFLPFYRGKIFLCIPFTANKEQEMYPGGPRLELHFKE